MEAPETQPDLVVQKNLRHNYIVNIFDGGFFGFALGFASFSTVLPLFISTLTNSAVLIGLIPAFHNTGFQLPQLFYAKKVSKMTRYKPAVVSWTIHERLPFVGLALIAFMIPMIGPEIALVLAFIMLAWQGLGAGFTANPWQNLINKVIPPDYLATFFGLQGLAANLLSSVGAVTAGFLLVRFPTPLNFSVCFIIAIFLFALSWFALNSNRELPHRVNPDGFHSLPFLAGIKSIWQKDRGFRWFLVVRNLSQFGTMAFAFYTVYAVKHHGMSEVTIGIMTGVLLITQTIANPLLGWLADRWSRRRVLEAGAMASAGSSLLAWLLPDTSVFFLIFILAGIASVVYWTIGMAFTLSYGNDEERPTYVGMANTLVAPSTIIAPILGGLLADSTGYPVTFAVATAASLATALILHFFVKDPRHT